MLEDNLLPIYNQLLPDGGHFVHDNCTIHTAAYTKNWLNEHAVALMDYPSVSPDMNSIENVWADLKKALYKRHGDVQNSDDLFRILSEEWNVLMNNEDYRINHIRSMVQRVHDLRVSAWSYTSW